MHMNLEQLRGFVEIAESGHFTRAAQQLHLAQPSLSRQISTLERELGAELFHRARGHIGLTAAGEALLPLARRMLEDAAAIHDEMAELAGLQRGRVRLGATPTLCITLLAEAVSAFHAQHPGIELQLSEGGSRLLTDQLAVGALDFALLPSSEGPAVAGVRLSRTPLLTEELVVIAAASGATGFDLPPSGVLTLAELARLPLISLAESYDLRGTTDAAFRAAGLAPTVMLQGAEMDAVLRFVERGLGVAVVPAMVLHDRPALRAVRLTEPRLTRTVSLAHRSDITPHRAAEAMREAIVDTVRALSAQQPDTISLLGG